MIAATLLRFVVVVVTVDDHAMLQHLARQLSTAHSAVELRCTAVSNGPNPPKIKFPHDISRIFKFQQIQILSVSKRKFVKLLQA